MKPIDKLILAILLGLVCPFALLVVPEMEEQDGKRTKGI